jgi:hypothetical protein
VAEEEESQPLEEGPLERRELTLPDGRRLLLYSRREAEEPED